MLHRSKPIIRHATRSDILQIEDLIVASLEPFRAVVPAATLDRYTNYSLNVAERWNSGDVLVTESNGVIVGTVTFVDHKRKAGEELPQGWASLRTLMVHPDARGKGLGRHLVNQCIDAARAGGAAVIGLHTGAFMDGARRIYRSAGFARCSEHDFLASAALGFDPAEGDVLVEAYRLDL